MSEIQVHEGVIFVRGEVTFETLSQLRKALTSSIQPGVHTLDCSDTGKVDSSIAALLLAAVSLAHTQELSLVVRQLPSAASKLLKLYDLDGIIHCQ